MSPARRTRIVYWGAPGAGKTESLRTLHRAFAPKMDARLRHVPSERDPGASIDLLELEVPRDSGPPHPVAVVAAPGAAAFEETRTRLLRGADAVVLVVDGSRLDENLTAMDELNRSLQAVGKSLASCPLVIQYHQIERANPQIRAELQRKLDPAFGSPGSGPLRQADSEIEAFRAALKASLRPPQTPTPLATTPPPAIDRDAVAQRAQQLFDANWRETVDGITPTGVAIESDRWSLASVGEVSQLDDRSLCIPLALRAPSDEIVEFTLTLSLDQVPGFEDE